MKLDEKALEAAIVAVESMGCVHFGAEIEAAIRAYLEAATPPDMAGLVRKIEAVTNRVTCDFDSRDELLSQAATALRLSAGGATRIESLEAENARLRKALIEIECRPEKMIWGGSTEILGAMRDMEDIARRAREGGNADG